MCDSASLVGLYVWFTHSVLGSKRRSMFRPLRLVAPVLAVLVGLVAGCSADQGQAFDVAVAATAEALQAEVLTVEPADAAPVASTPEPAPTLVTTPTVVPTPRPVPTLVATPTAVPTPRPVPTVAPTPRPVPTKTVIYDGRHLHTPHDADEQLCLVLVGRCLRKKKYIYL